MKNNFHLVCSVWGKEFVEFFCTFTIPTLLSDNNLILVASKTQITFTIVTNGESTAYFKKFSAYRELEELVDVQFVDSEISTQKLKKTSHWQLWHVGIRARQEINNVAIVIPDCIYADGILNEIYTALQDGADIVYYPLPQVCQELIQRDFDDGWEFKNESREFFEKLWIEYLNPKHAALLESSSLRVAHPEYVIRGSQAGLQFIELAGHGLAINQGSPYVSAIFNPLSEKAAISVLKFGGVSCEPTLKFHEQYVGFWRPPGTGMGAAAYASWAAHFRDDYFDQYSSHVHSIGLSEEGDGFRDVSLNRFASLRYDLKFAEIVYAVKGAMRERCGQGLIGVLPVLFLDRFFKRTIVRNVPSVIYLPCDADAIAGHFAEKVLNGCQKTRRAIVLAHCLENFIQHRIGDCIELEHDGQPKLGNAKHIIDQNEMSVEPSSHVTIRGSVVSRPTLLRQNLFLVFYKPLEYQVMD